MRNSTRYTTQFIQTINCKEKEKGKGYLVRQHMSLIGILTVSFDEWGGFANGWVSGPIKELLILVHVIMT